MGLKKYDPRRHNGAILLGLNGIAVKSHGSADARAFANAIKVAVMLVENNVNQKITEELSKSAVKSDMLSSDSNSMNETNATPFFSESVA